MGNVETTLGQLEVDRDKSEVRKIRENVKGKTGKKGGRRKRVKVKLWLFLVSVSFFDFRVIYLLVSCL